MIVGKIDVDRKLLVIKSRSKEEFLEYCDSLVPVEFRHQRAILDNQRYYCCLLLRSFDSVSWSTKKSLLDELLVETRIVGFTDVLIEVSTLYDMVNKSRLHTIAKGGY